MRYKHLLAGVLVVLTLLVSSSTALAQVLTRTIEVQGISVIPVEPNGIWLDIAIENLSTNLPEAYRGVRQQMTLVRDAIVELGVAPEDVRPFSIAIVPEDRIDQRLGPGPTGEFLYRATITSRLYVRQIALVDGVVQTAVDLGANTVSPFFFLYDDLTGFQAQARLAAMQDATARAQVIADFYGLSLRAPVSIQERLITGVSETILADASSGRFNVTVLMTVTFEVEPLRP
jgi:uncharacterized protein